jgi:NAD(P)H-hydrate epimerase
MCGVTIPGLTPLFDSAALRSADARAIAGGIPGEMLMERAGLAASREILATFPSVSKALVLAGPGNNGGDGWVVARHLAEAGWDVTVALPGGRRPETPDAIAMAARAEEMGIAVVAADPGDIATGDAVVIDAMLGTGTSGAPRGAIGEVVAAVIASGAPVVALDVPTGVDADTGRVDGNALRARVTITFAGDMPGLRVAPGRGHAGRVVVADIGIPRDLQPDPAAWLADDGAVTAIPQRGDDDDKYAAGGVLVIAGAPGMSGAARLSTRAALRAGAGIVVGCVPPSVRAEVAAWTPEVMISGNDRDEIDRQLARVGAVALGPGLGREDTTTALVHDLTRSIRQPLVLDADGLWHLGSDLAPLRDRQHATVITPHCGEAARLLGISRPEVEAARLDAAQRLADGTGHVALLKGPGTIIAAPGRPPVVLEGGTPALATAGSGDVLTGVIAALLARGMGARSAAVAGAALHARAGVLAGRGDGTIASDIIEALPEARAV